MHLTLTLSLPLRLSLCLFSPHLTFPLPPPPPSLLLAFSHSTLPPPFPPPPSPASGLSWLTPPHPTLATPLRLQPCDPGLVPPFSAPPLYCPKVRYYTEGPGRDQGLHEGDVLLSNHPQASPPTCRGLQSRGCQGCMEEVIVWMNSLGVAYRSLQSRGCQGCTEDVTSWMLPATRRRTCSVLSLMYAHYSLVVRKHLLW